MVIIDSSHFPQCPFDARWSTFHDTIDPSPDEGTHSRMSDWHDEQVTVNGASNFAQFVQRRIIKVTRRWSVIPLTRGGCSGSWRYMRILGLILLLCRLQTPSRCSSPRRSNCRGHTYFCCRKRGSHVRARDILRCITEQDPRMSEIDPLNTQRDVIPTITAELAEAGFSDAHEIGRGGFGVVYRCTQAALDRTVAVKVLAADLDKGNRERFVREQRAMGRLTGHPNIVAVLQAGATVSGLAYLVMPYYPQDSLDARIRRHGPLSVEEALRLGVKIAGALETAHRLGILHRDVKPSNLLITDYGEPALTDFGIAHIAGGFRTASGAVAGSPAFTAPEVLAGEEPTPVADVYGLGATLFAALTGHAAFERRRGEQVVAQFVRITTQPVPSLRDHGIDDDLSTVIEHAMARTPRQRPSASALGEELQRVQAGSGSRVDEMAVRAEADAGRNADTPVPLIPLSTRSPVGAAAAVDGVERGDEDSSARADELRRPPHRIDRNQAAPGKRSACDVDRDRRGGQNSSCFAGSDRCAARLCGRSQAGGARRIARWCPATGGDCCRCGSAPAGAAGARGADRILGVAAAAAGARQL
ncbi:serine/threonine-protein kinase [Nocardia amamiensis]